MPDKGIPMSAPMVRAIRAGRKSVTRRPIKPQPPERSHHARVEDRWVWYDPGCVGDHYPPEDCRKPRLQPGDVAWVQETWGHSNEDPLGIVYRADPGGDDDMDTVDGKWKPSTNMPKWASRLWAPVLSSGPEQVDGIWVWRYEFGSWVGSREEINA